MAPETITIDLTHLPEAGTYENTYGNYLNFFKACAEKAGEIVILNAPASWFPLLWHLNCNVRSVHSARFEHCRQVWAALQIGVGIPTHGEPWSMSRTMVEVLCAFRPETTDGLWKCDMQWDVHPDRIRKYPPEAEFIITTNGAFHRREIKDYFLAFDEYKPPSKNVVIVPCAADKPYPAPLHKAVLARMPSDFYLMTVTGALGFVPQELWPVMPNYDAGIPNEWRVFNVALRYFQKFLHDRIIIYDDYYALTLYHALTTIDQIPFAEFLIKPGFYPDYLNLLSKSRLDELEQAFKLRPREDGV